MELKLNLSTGWNQHYFSLLRASQRFKYTTDAIISACTHNNHSPAAVHGVPAPPPQFLFTFYERQKHITVGDFWLHVCFCACDARMEHFSSAASYLVDTGGSIVPPAWRPGCRGGTWGRNVRNKSPGYRDIHTADTCRQSTELNPGWCGR